MSEVWATGVWATSSTPTPDPVIIPVGRGGIIGELFDSTELYATVELTSTVIFINPKNIIRVRNQSNTIKVR